MSKKTIRRAAFLCAALFLIGATGLLYTFEKQCDSVRREVLRLHVRAASDSAEDQALKIAVRDRLLSESDRWFSASSSREEAQTALSDRLAEVEAVCREELRRQGSDQQVTVTLGQSSFPTRTYGELTLPAGYYEALIVELGSGQGQNWWCVLFPSVCIPAASEVTEADFGENGHLVYEEGVTYRIGFRAVEWYYRLRDFFRTR